VVAVDIRLDLKGRKDSDNGAAGLPLIILTSINYV
jgi:hypothetical protein